jgi:RNA-directed DNA polymerase
MENLIAPKGLKLGIFRALKAGINPEFPEQGTPQGGVVSPLLANIALNGIEECHRTKDSQGKMGSRCVRYADDMVFFLKPNDDEKEILDKIKRFLAKRGLEVSKKKTKLTASIDGFDFLGWHFKVQQNGKLRCTPSVDNFKAFRKKVKEIVNNSNYGAKVKAEKLAPIVRVERKKSTSCT